MNLYTIESLNNLLRISYLRVNYLNGVFLSVFSSFFSFSWRMLEVCQELQESFLLFLNSVTWLKVRSILPCQFISILSHLFFSILSISCFYYFVLMLCFHLVFRPPLKLAKSHQNPRETLDQAYPSHHHQKNHSTSHL